MVKKEKVPLGFLEKLPPSCLQRLKKFYTWIGLGTCHAQLGWLSSSRQSLSETMHNAPQGVGHTMNSDMNVLPLSSRPPQADIAWSENIPELSYGIGTRVSYLAAPGYWANRPLGGSWVNPTVMFHCGDPQLLQPTCFAPQLYPLPAQCLLNPVHFTEPHGVYRLQHHLRIPTVCKT